MTNGCTGTSLTAKNVSETALQFDDLDQTEDSREELRASNGLGCKVRFPLSRAI